MSTEKFITLSERLLGISCLLIAVFFLTAGFLAVFGIIHPVTCQ